MGLFIEQKAITAEQEKKKKSRKRAITVEYLPRLVNVEADTQSRTVRDASEWKLNPRIFQKICKYRGAPEIDLFAS